MRVGPESRPQNWPSVRAQERKRLRRLVREGHRRRQGEAHHRIDESDHHGGEHHRLYDQAGRRAPAGQPAMVVHGLEEATSTTASVEHQAKGAEHQRQGELARLVQAHPQVARPGRALGCSTERRTAV